MLTAERACFRMQAVMHGCLQVEYHLANASLADAGEQQISPRQMLHIMRGLVDRGLRVISNEPNYWWGLAD